MTRSLPANTGELRSLATIRQIHTIEPIEGADLIELAKVDNWQVVVKKGEYQVNDLAVYLEIDSFVPTALAPYLTRPGHTPKEYLGVLGERLKTVRLKKQLSQGLLLPLHMLPESFQDQEKIDIKNPIGEDVTDFLGILKWEPPISPALAGVAKGNFPSCIPKTDQERVQNLKYIPETLYEVSEKLEGSSMTCYIIDGVFGVCSRNVDLVESPANTFWQVARKLNIEAMMRREAEADNYSFAIQGELVGPGIQNNIYNLPEHDLFIYDIFDITYQRYLSASIRRSLIAFMGLKSVPIVEMYNNYADHSNPKKLLTHEAILAMAEGTSKLNPKQEREGLVFKAYDGQSSFKAISNKYLLKG
jgi:RNA ligase (TIGR02306 family)